MATLVKYRMHNLKLNPTTSMYCGAKMQSKAGALKVTDS
jgi:hypothetical protein